MKSDPYDLEKLMADKRMQQLVKQRPELEERVRELAQERLTEVQTWQETLHSFVENKENAPFDWCTLCLKHREWKFHETRQARLV